MVWLLMREMKMDKKRTQKTTGKLMIKVQDLMRIKEKEKVKREELKEKLKCSIVQET